MPRNFILLAKTALLVWLTTGAWPLLAQQLGRGEDIGVSIWRVLGALLFCLLLAFAAIAVIRRKGGGRIDLAALTTQWRARAERPRRRIEVLESRRLSQHADICLVRHDEREYLLLLSASQMQTLSEGDRPARPDPVPSLPEVPR